MDILQEIKRMVEVTIAPIKLLPFENDYRQGQIDFAETIIRLIEVAQNLEGTKNAEAMELRTVGNG